MAAPPTPSQTLLFVTPSAGTPECGPQIEVLLQVATSGLAPATLSLSLDGVLQPGVLSVQGAFAAGTLTTPGPGPHTLAATVQATSGSWITTQVNFEVLTPSPPQPAVAAPDLLHDSFSGMGSTSLGFSVAMLGDLDGDQRAELLVGEPHGDGAAPNSGRARVISGGTGLELRVHDGLASGDLFGADVTATGDVDGDGIADYAVSACKAAGSVPGGGTVTVYSGAAGLVIHTLQGDEASANYGVSIDGAGDVDQDGRADVIVGCNESDVTGVVSGRVLVYSGMQGGVLYDIPGNAATDQLGVGVAGVGDMDGDGAGDFAAGAWGEDWNGPSSGSARVWSGATGALLYRFDGDLPSDHLGFSVAGVGDVDGDGRPDLLVGITESDAAGVDSGAARLYSGRTGATLMTLTGDSACDFFGISVAGAGDVNGDGTRDLIVGSFLDVGPAGETGSATIFSGVDGAPLLRVRGTSELDLFGSCVAGGRDLNGDGRPDLAVGAPDSSAIFTKGGEIRSWSALPLRLTAPGSSLLLATGTALELVVDMGPSGAGRPYEVVLQGSGASHVGKLPANGFLDLDGRATIELQLASTAPGNLFLARPSVRVVVGSGPGAASTNSLLLTLNPL